MVEIIQDYNISNLLGVFVLDNAGSNDTAVHHIISELQLPSSEHWIRLRCFGHIINLAATEFIFGANSDQFLQQISTLEINDLRDQLQEKWLLKGAIGKLQNLISLIRSSPQRRRAFLSLQAADSDVKQE